jgi:hypothetical protein
MLLHFLLLDNLSSNDTMLEKNELEKIRHLPGDTEEYHENRFSGISRIHTQSVTARTGSPRLV